MRRKFDYKIVQPRHLPMVSFRKPSHLVICRTIPCMLKMIQINNEMLLLKRLALFCHTIAKVLIIQITTNKAIGMLTLEPVNGCSR
mmetsp:Transcript_9819/g.15174  ORF Transcript_9819/g.15174 Transcript_9819/m.15174 type:complete len:86 (-) Transcript_9819:142-399(-)